VSRARDNAAGLAPLINAQVLCDEPFTANGVTGRCSALRARQTPSEHPVPRSTLSSATVVAGVIAAFPVAQATSQQSDVSISPFVTFLPATGSNPLAGLALTLAGDAGFALRASGHLSLENTNSAGFGNASYMRPWGADADAMLSIGGRAFGGYNRTFAPFVFAGIGTAAKDSVGMRISRTNWSYGAGASIPLGSAVDLFGESRWRMPRYVLPTAIGAPRPMNEFRIGLSFHVASSSGRRSRSTTSRRAESGPPISLPSGRGSTSASAARILGTADDYVGVPYRYGGTSPSSGFDCSGFVQYVFAKHGVTLPRTSRQQAQVGQAIAADWRAVSAGDLVMFADDGRISHVAIYAGRNRIIHSSSSGGGVRFDDLSTHRGEWFLDHMVAARRVTPDSRGLLLDLARGFSELGIQLDGPDRAPRPK
jgi:cell wall-associated NlpC family hydrolase